MRAVESHACHGQSRVRRRCDATARANGALVTRLGKVGGVDDVATAPYDPGGASGLTVAPPAFIFDRVGRDRLVRRSIDSVPSPLAPTAGVEQDLWNSGEHLRLEDTRMLPLPTTALRASVCAFALLLLPLDAALGQDSLHLRALETPHGMPLRCRPVAPDTANASLGAAFWFEFYEGVEPNGRALHVAFDSTGAPVYLAVQLFSDGVGSGGEVLGARFAGNDQAVGARWNLPPLDSARARSMKRTMLTPPELVSARSLARWLWEHRCARHPPSG